MSYSEPTAATRAGSSSGPGGDEIGVQETRAGAAACCPLCGGTDARVLETIPLADLEGEYQRQVGVSILREFPSGLRELELLRCRGCGLEFFEPLVAGSGDFYAGLSQDACYYSKTRWEFTEALKRIPAGAEVLDVGCGDGFFLNLVSGPKRGVELNPEAARRARAAGLRVDEIRLEDLPPGSADVVTMFQVLEHVARPRETLDAARAALREGGRLLVAVPNNDNWVGSAPVNPLNAPPHHPLRWRAEALRHVPKVAGFALEELLEEPLAPEHAHPYRRSQFMRAAGRLAGWQPPRYRRRVAAIALRKAATVWAEAMLRLAPIRSAGPGTGHSLLAVYRRV